MKSTAPSLLAVWFGVTAVVVGVVAQLTYDKLPPLPRGPVITIGAVAFIEMLLAWTTRNRLRAMREQHEKKLDRSLIKPIEPMLVARYAVLARASSLAGAIAAGAWTGLLVVLLARRSVDAVDVDRRVSIAGLIAALLLVGAALWLEWVCRAPPPPHEREQSRAHAA